MKLPLILLVIICLFVAGVTVFVWSGVYDVAANVPHWSITRWFLEEARERSVSAHSKGITVPQVKDSKLTDAGFRHYDAMCRLCHNAPGYPRTEISQGLYPVPPDFTARGTKLPNDAELFWIVRNGIKMTGMPSFGATHSEEELWGIVLFARRVSNMKREEYDGMVKASMTHKDMGHHH